MHTTGTMHKTEQLLADEQGTALISSLLVLMLMTFIAIASTQTTIVEKAVVRSDSIFQQDFYLAESASLEGIQRLANESTPEELLAPLIVTGTSNNDGLLINFSDPDTENYLENIDASLVGNNDGTISGSDDGFDVSENDPATFRLVIQMPIQAGSSLALGSSRQYNYNSYGLSEAHGGRVMISTGYKRRF